jgi:S1-C subfamily serine protease
MQRFIPYLGVVLALFVGAFVWSFSHGVIPSSPTSHPSAGLAVLPSITLPALALPALDTTAPAAPESAGAPVAMSAAPVPVVASPTPAAKAASPARPSAPAATPLVSPAPTAVPATPDPLPSSGDASLDATATALRAALVNIVCYAPAGSALHSISGSGVVIDPKGIILTNAHVAQYFLLADKGIDCTIRAGSPAVDRYRAALIYISPAWLHANATVLSQTLPSGTGQYDFALLAIDQSMTADALPAAFPSVPLAARPSTSGTPVVIASYGAQFLATSQIQSSLFPTVVFGSVKDIYTFDTNTVDVLALGGSAAAQEGSSGGGVANASGELVGTITTSTVSGATDTRSLDAITASYIRGEYASEMGSALDLLLGEPTAVAIAEFAAKIPALELIISANI